MERLFSQELKVINIGLPEFLETLIRSGVDARQVDLGPEFESDIE
jgi:hypothetical protein